MSQTGCASCRTVSCEDSRVSGHVVAMGGGGFLTGDLTSPLDDLLLSLAGSERPHVVFLPTATGDSAAAQAAFEDAWSRRPCTRDVVCLFGIPDHPAERVAAADVVVVAGGNTANMLALWRLHDIDEALASAWSRGAALGGVSAGGELLVRGLRDGLVLGRARRPRGRARAPRGQLLPPLRRRGAPPARLHASRRRRLPGRDRVRRRGCRRLSGHRSCWRSSPTDRARSATGSRRRRRARSRPASCGREEGLRHLLCEWQRQDDARP